MLRIIAFIVGALVLLLVMWWVFAGLLHLLVLGFWVVLIALLGIGLFRVTRWSRSRSSR